MSKPRVIFSCEPIDEIVSMIEHKGKIFIATRKHIYEYHNESFRVMKLREQVTGSKDG